MITKNCLTCGKEFKVRPSRVKMGFGKFCSIRCKRPSKKTIEKMIKSKKGKYLGKESCHWNGGKMKDKDGYILIHKPNHPFKTKNNYVLEHRLVIESQIGRYLTPEQTTHHRGKIDDNRLRMLMLFSSKSAHVRFHCNPNNVKPEEIIFDGRDLSLQENYK